MAKHIAVRLVTVFPAGKKYPARYARHLYCQEQINKPVAAAVPTKPESVHNTKLAGLQKTKL